MSQKYDVIVIGAGVGGLTAAALLAKHGKKVLVLEKNHVPGGAVTTFYRNNYPIDISHALCALRTGAVVRKMFDCLGITQRIEMIALDKSFTYINGSGQPIFGYSDINQYEDEVIRHFPLESDKIRRFLKQTLQIWDKEIIDSYCNPSLGMLALYPFLFPHLVRYLGYTFDDYLDGFKLSSGLRDVLSVGWQYLGLDRGHVSALYMICLIGSYCKDGSYFIKGGIGKIVLAIEEVLREAGGELKCNIEVQEILTDERKRACGVKDNKNNIYQAEVIISNIDSKRMYNNLISRYATPVKVARRVNNFTMSCSMVQVHLVVDVDVPKEYLSTGTIMMPFGVDPELPLKKALKVDDGNCNDRKVILGINRLKDFSMPDRDGEFIFNIGILSANYELWDKFSVSFGRKAYDDLKIEVGQLVAQEVCKSWRVRNVKFIHVMTPLSFARWIGATQGAVYDAACSAQQVFLNRLGNRSKVKNLYSVGAKTFPGPGVIGAFISAFALSDLLLGGRITHGKFTV